MVVNGPSKNETQLMRDCAGLYVSFALESFFTVVMGVIFSYLLLLITNKGRLQRPGKAMAKMIFGTVEQFVTDITTEVKKWPTMVNEPLEKRFAICRKANQGICAFTVFVGLLTLTRWAHFNNVNAFRYLGYCITCPPKQAELVLLIAPTIPCYRFMIIMTCIVTSMMCITGYAASVVTGDLYDGSLYDFIDTWDVSVLKPTLKMYWLIPASVLLTWLSLIQIPLLMLWYKCHGGESAGLPHGYCKLCAIVSLSWLAFPCWWILSYEGASLIKDTKMNAIGFATLNVISKGSFTLQMLSMAAWHRNFKKRQEAIARGTRPVAPSSIFAEDARISTKSIDLESLERSAAKKETTIITLLQAYDEKMPVQEIGWSQLEPTQRAYFLGNGITPQKFNAMSMQERHDLISDYASIFDMMVNDEANEAAPGNWPQPKYTPSAPAALPVAAGGAQSQVARPEVGSPVQQQQHMPPAAQSQMREEAAGLQLSPPASARMRQEPRIIEEEAPLPPPPHEEAQVQASFVRVQEQPAKVVEEAPPNMEEAFVDSHIARQMTPLSEACTAASSEETMQSCEGGLVVGQKVTTTDGTVGRVLKVTEDQVQLSMKRGKKQIVMKDDIMKVVMNLDTVEGSQASTWQRNLKNARVYATCSIEGKPGTEIRTPARNFQGDKISLGHQASIFGFALYDTLVYCVYAREEGQKKDVLLGEVRIDGSEFQDDGFEGPLPLTIQNEMVQAHLNLMIFVSGTNRESTTASSVAPAVREARVMEVEVDERRGGCFQCR